MAGLRRLRARGEERSVILISVFQRPAAPRARGREMRWRVDGLYERRLRAREGEEG